MHPPPHIEESLEPGGFLQWMWQVATGTCDRKRKSQRLCFTPFGLFEFKQMPFELPFGSSWDIPTPYGANIRSAPLPDSFAISIKCML